MKDHLIKCEEIWYSLEDVGYKGITELVLDRLTPDYRILKSTLHGAKQQNQTQVVTIPPQIKKINKPLILSRPPPSQDTNIGCQICDKFGYLARNCPDKGIFSYYITKLPG